MAPKGTARQPGDQGLWWYYQISSENNISWYAALRMLHQITGEDQYQEMMGWIESYFQSAWNSDENYFYQGMTFNVGGWEHNDDNFALDVQTWALLAFGPQKIDDWFYEGASFQMWKKLVGLSGARDASGKLLGVGFIEEHDRISIEWSAGAIMAGRIISDHYQDTFPQWSAEALQDANQMRAGVDAFRHNVAPNRAAYSYSSKRGWIPFGWNSHAPEVLSLASTGWIQMVDAQINPFHLSS